MTWCEVNKFKLNMQGKLRKKRCFVTKQKTFNFC